VLQVKTRLLNSPLHFFDFFFFSSSATTTEWNRKTTELRSHFSCFRTSSALPGPTPSSPTPCRQHPSIHPNEERNEEATHLKRVSSRSNKNYFCALWFKNKQKHNCFNLYVNKKHSYPHEKKSISKLLAATLNCTWEVKWLESCLNSKSSPFNELLLRQDERLWEPDVCDRRHFILSDLVQLGSNNGSCSSGPLLPTAATSSRGSSCSRSHGSQSRRTSSPTSGSSGSGGSCGSGLRRYSAIPVDVDNRWDGFLTFLLSQHYGTPSSICINGSGAKVFQLSFHLIFCVTWPNHPCAVNYRCEFYLFFVVETPPLSDAAFSSLLPPFIPLIPSPWSPTWSFSCLHNRRPLRGLRQKTFCFISFIPLSILCVCTIWPTISPTGLCWIRFFPEKI